MNTANKSAASPRTAAGLCPDRALGEPKSMSEYDTDGSESSESIVCPWEGCGCEFGNDRGMKVHHIQAHGVSISENKSFPGDHDCPRPGCNDSFQSEKAMKVHHAQIHGESIAGVEVDCAYCGESKRINSAEQKSSENHFCDKGCKGEWMSDNQTGEGNPMWGGGNVTVECAVCGDERHVTPSTAEKKPRHFCCHEHSSQWISENRVGEAHHQWKGGVFTYGKGWNVDKREKIRNRQNRECKGCGLHESETTRKLTVHHIQKARSFDDPEKRNDESNLVALCRDCHRVWEQMSPLRPQTMV